MSGFSGDAISKNTTLAEERSDGAWWKPALVCLGTALLVCTLGTWRLDTHSMEGIIALGGEHMAASGEWFVPRLYGTVYAYKPAMCYWLAALSMHVLGRNEFALRLPTALCAVAMCMATFWVMARLTTARCGMYSALAMCFAALFIENGRIASYDTPLALGVGVAMLAATRNLVVEKASLGWWIAAYLGLAFGFLSKGLPALGMFGPGLIAAALVVRRLERLFSWRHILGAAVGAAVIGAYLYLAWREAGADAFKDQGGEVSYRGVLWTWAEVGRSLIKPMVIWAVFLPGSLLVPAWPWLWKRYRAGMPARAQATVLALGAFLVTGVVVWMFIPTKSSRYYLPLIAAAAGLAGLAGEVISAGAFGRDGGVQGICATGPGLVRRWVRAYWPGVVLMVMGAGYWIAYAGFVQPGKVATKSEREVAAAFAQHLAPGETVYFRGFDMGSSLFFYLQHPVERWGFRAAPISENFAVTINWDNSEQRPALMARTDIRVEIVAAQRTGEGRLWELARVRPAR